MRILLLLIVVTGCAEEYTPQKSLELISCEQARDMFRNSFENEAMMHRYHIAFPPTQVCLENNLLTGCQSFKAYLASKNIKLEASDWEYCKQFEEPTK